MGRLTQQRLAGKDATLNDAGLYVGTGVAESWTDVFSYDARSNLTSHTDARGVKTIYAYGNDPLNRLQSVTYDTSGVGGTSADPVLPAASVRFEYTSSGRSSHPCQTSTEVGDPTRPWRVTVDGVSVEEYAYDAEGRLCAKALTLADRPNHPLVTEYTFDDLDRVTDIRYPAAYGTPAAPRKLVHYDYGLGDRLRTLTVDGEAYASDIAHNAAGQMTSLTVGGSGPQAITELYGYDPATGLLERQEVQRAGRPLLDLSYHYQEPGRVTGRLRQMDDNLDPRKSRTYEYDAVGRLKRATGGDRLWSQEYGYHRYGSRTSVDAVGATADGVPVPRDGLADVGVDSEQQQVLRPRGFEYDEAGNLTRGLRADGSWHRYQYDAAGRLAKVLDDAGTTLEAYTYGVDRRRLVTHRGEPSEDRTYYAWGGNAVIGEYSEAAVSPTEPRWTKGYVQLGWRLLATLEPGAAAEVVRYHHRDRTGTRRLMIDREGGAVTEQVTLPYGTFLPGESTAAATNRLFTSYDRSVATGLDYALNRYYDPQQGRFLQPDPLGIAASDLGNPQSLNLYNYAGNDPVNVADPLGLLWMEVCIPRVPPEGGPNETVVIAPFCYAYEYPGRYFRFSPPGERDIEHVGGRGAGGPHNRSDKSGRDACADMADVAQFVANQATASAAGDLGTAVKDFEIAFSQLYVGGSLDSIGSALELWLDHGLRKRRITRSYLGQSGFKWVFLDKDGGDQTHHFAAYLSAGVHAQLYTAVAHAYQDLARDNPGDYFLGAEAYDIGRNLAINPGRLSQIGREIRARVCTAR